MLRKRSALWACCSLLLLGMVGIAIGQIPRRTNTLQPDPGARFLVVDMAQIVPGVILDEETVEYLPVEKLGTASYEYPAIRQSWSRLHGSHPVRFACTYAHLPSRSDAAAVFSYLKSSFPTSTFSELEGWDAAHGNRPGNVVALLDRAVVWFGGGGQDVSTREADKRVLDTFLDVERTRISATATKAPLFNVQADVLSKHVNRRKGQVVRLRVTSNQQDFFPLGTFTTVWIKATPQSAKLGGLACVYDATQTGEQGIIEFTWDGRDRKGQFVSNGVYALYCTSRDRVGRTKLFGPFDIEVNNQ